MTLRTSSHLSELTQAELLTLLGERLEAATRAEAAAQAANDAVAEVMALLHRPMPMDAYWSRESN